ncbi:MAG: iron-containing alcohol dehydrogenase [Mycoplasma sp.]
MISFQLKPKYYFGRQTLNNLTQEVKEAKYKNVLILFGGGSIKQNGVYDSIHKQLTDLKVNIFEFNGIEPNPRHTTISNAAKYCHQNKIDLIIAAGGGSVIDASKVIATLATNQQITDCWDYVMKKVKAEHPPIDIFSVITLAGTASENNSGSVVSNLELGEKKGVLSPLATPKVAFEDSSYTLTLSPWQTSSGIFDCISHLLEQFYSKNPFLWTKEYILANLKTVLKASYAYLKDNNDLVARDNILWTTSMALNGLGTFNSDGGDWNVHTLEHALSAKWDVTHGAGLALLTPEYIKYRCSNEEWFKELTIELANELFNVSTVDDFISELIKYIKELKLPLKWTDFSEIKEVSQNDIEWLASHSFKFSSGLSKEQYLDILKRIKI